jgi:hypothetical protein
MSTFADPKPAQLPGEQGAKELLQYRMRLAQELVDIRHDRVRAIASQILGERPPDTEGIERLRSVTRDLEAARESLIDATCRWHHFVFRGNVLS